MSKQNQHKPNVPKLRFPEFSGEWEEFRLKDIANFSKGKSISKGDLSEEGVSCILYGELYTRYGAMIKEIYSKTDLDTSKLKKGEENEVLIPSSGETAIDIATASTIDTNQEVYIGGDLNIITPKSNFDGRFISLSINGVNKLSLAKYAQGKSVVHLYNNDIKSLLMKFPQDLKEQKKISDFFSKLDRQIELEEKKLALLEEQKKGYMQKIFSRELRFKDENGNEYPEWEEKKLGDIISYRNGFGYEKETVNNGKYNIVNLSSINIKGELVNSKKYTDNNRTLLNESDIVMILSDVAKGNLIGKTAVIDRDNFYVQNQRIGRLEPKNTVSSFFLSSAINYYRSYFVKMATGMSQLNIDKRTVIDYKIKIPSYNEQLNITNFFKKIIYRETKTRKRIACLKKRKNEFAKKMFI